MMLESLVVFILSNFSKVSANPPFACKPINLQAGHESGFSVSFYNYPFQDNDLLRDLMFMEGGFKASQKQTGSAIGATDISFSFSNARYDNFGDLYEDIYETSVNIQSFLMYLEGYLYIDAPGEYTFNLDADDGALVRFGGDQAFKCCNTDGIIQSKSYSLWAHWDSQTNVVGETTQTYNLTAGYYPILITYVNMQIPIVFTFSITLPNGDVVTDFSNVYQIPNQEFECPAVVTPSVGWSQSYTSAITYSASSYDNNSVGIFSPTTTPRNISTTTTPCIGFTPSLTNLTPTSSVTTTTVEVLKPINTASTPCSITTISTSWTGFTTSSTTLNSTRTDGTTSEILSHSVAISSCQKFYNSTEVISHITVPIPSTLTNFITLTSLKSTLITVTSKDNHCTPVPVVTGYVVITDESKIYTMYSPLISEAPTSGTTGPHSHPESTTTATTDLGFVFTTTTTPVINGSISVPSTSSITEIKTITIPTIPATHLGSGNSLPLSSIATSNKHSISEQPISAPPISTIYEGFGNKLCSSLFLLIINVCAILV